LKQTSSLTASMFWSEPCSGLQLCKHDFPELNQFRFQISIIYKIVCINMSYIVWSLWQSDKLAKLFKQIT